MDGVDGVESVVEIGVECGESGVDCLSHVFMA